MKKQYLDYAGLKRVLKHLLPGARKIWHGTLAEWEALSEAERDKYDQAEVIDGSSVDTHLVRRPAWNQATATGLSGSLRTYTAPSDGMIVGTLFTNGNTSTGTSVIVNGVEVARNKSKDSDRILNVQCTVNKGDVITIASDASSTDSITSTIRFVPFEDSTVSDVEVVSLGLIRNLHDPDWSQAVSITAAQLIEGYTVPKRGIITGSIIPNTYDVTGAPIIKINDVVVSYARGSSNEITHGSVQCPVCAYDVIKLEGTGAESCDAHISFVPYKAQ